jgi:DNA-binding transcriptional LysR family regulator
MELRQLRYFVAVAEEQNLTRAAARLRIAQPPLSVQIQKLESELGVPLLHRLARGVTLTEAGRALLEDAHRIIAEVDRAAREVADIGAGAVGRLSLGFVPSASNAVLPPLLREFKAAYPQVALFLREQRPDEIVAQLHDRRIDAGLFYLPFSDPDLRVRTVAEEPLVLALPSEHRLAGRAEVGLAELAGEAFIMPARHDMPGLYAIVSTACHRAGFTPTVVQGEVWLMQTIVGLVAGGVGIAMVPESVRHLHRSGVTYLPLRDADVRAEMGIAWRDDTTSPVLQAFLDLV